MCCKNACFLGFFAVLALMSIDAHAVSSVRVLGMPAGTSPTKPSVVRTGSAANAGANMAPVVKKATSGAATPALGRAASKLSSVSSLERIPNAKPKINVKSVANSGTVTPIEVQQMAAVAAINDKVSELESRVNDINMGDYYTQGEIDNLVADTLDDYDVAVDEKIDARLAEIESVASVENITALQADTEANTQNIESNTQGIIDNTNQINELRDSLATTNALLENSLENSRTLYNSETGTYQRVKIVDHVSPEMIELIENVFVDEPTEQQVETVRQ